MQAPHTSPRHLNTISQDVETISILKGEERLADRLPRCGLVLCRIAGVAFVADELSGVPGTGWRRPLSGPSPFRGHKPSFNIYFGGGSGGGVASLLSFISLRPVPHLKLSVSLSRGSLWSHSGTDIPNPSPFPLCSLSFVSVPSSSSSVPVSVPHPCPLSRCGK